MVYNNLKEKYPKSYRKQDHGRSQDIGHPDLRPRLIDLVIDVLLVLEQFPRRRIPQGHGSISLAYCYLKQQPNYIFRFTRKENKSDVCQTSKIPWLEFTREFDVSLFACQVFLEVRFRCISSGLGLTLRP